MKQFPSEKYNVAWFKLAECVTRGEKERALGVYKLLSYSIEDRAFASQLEGDLLLAFEDDLAKSKYVESAQLYKKQQRFVESAAVYEHLLMLEPDVEGHAVNVIALYQILNFSDKMQQHLRSAIDRFAASSDSKKLNAFLTSLEEMSPSAHKEACKIIS